MLAGKATVARPDWEIWASNKNDNLQSKKVAVVGGGGGGGCVASWEGSSLG